MKQKRPEPHQIAGIIVAKAAGLPIPEAAKDFAHHVGFSDEKAGRVTKDKKAPKKKR